MKILDKIINILIIIGLIYIIICISSEIYKNITITNKIENPSICIEINDEYYCRVEEKQEKTRTIEA
jgi:hypothetical protein